MKNTVLKYYIAVFYLCSSFIMFAQQPGDGNGGIGDDALEGADAPAAAPIDDYVGVLALIGLVYIFFKFKTIHNKKMHT